MVINSIKSKMNESNESNKTTIPVSLVSLVIYKIWERIFIEMTKTLGSKENPCLQNWKQSKILSFLMVLATLSQQKNKINT